MRKLVFTSHCICFYYIMICLVSSAYTIGIISFAWSQCIGCYFEQVIISVISFTALFANRIMICSTSAQVVMVLSCLCNPSALVANFEQVIVLDICFLQPDTDLFHVSSSSTCVIGFVSFAFTVRWLTSNRSLFRFYCFWH